MGSYVIVGFDYSFDTLFFFLQFDFARVGGSGEFWPWCAYICNMNFYRFVLFNTFLVEFLTLFVVACCTFLFYFNKSRGVIDGIHLPKKIYKKYFK